MNKLTTLLAVATLALAVGACKKKRETEQKDDPSAMRPAEEPKPAPKPDDKPKPPEAAAEVPAECTAYKELVDKLPACEKLPQKARDALKATYDNAAKAWATPPADDAARKTLADSCKTNTDALRSAAAAPCGW